ncbi:MAG TPA: hypothetical protein VFC65_04380 [Prolixibacteraceae bacterium]|nr:hypothetical protein [Prolixibacteraceae bacterium]
MKTQTDIETKAKCQNRLKIKDAFTGSTQTSLWQNPKQELLRSICSTDKPWFSLPSEGKQNGGFNFGNDPPGRSRSPDQACGLNPEKRFVALQSCKTNSKLNFNCFKNFTMI